METLMNLLKGFWDGLHTGLLPNLGYWNYFLLAALVAVEGPIATTLGAAAASAGLLRPGLVFLAASFGNLSADCLWYSLGSAGKIEWLLHYGKLFGIRPSHLEKLQRGMERHAPQILLLAKLTLSLVIPSLIAAGLAKIPWKRWFPAVALGEVVWTGSLVVIGYYATGAIIRIVQRDGRYLVVGGLVVFVIGCLWLLRRSLLRKLRLIGALFNSTIQEP